MCGANVKNGTDETTGTLSPAAFDFDTKFCKVTINHVNEEVECIDHKNTKPMKIEKK